MLLKLLSFSWLFTFVLFPQIGKAQVKLFPNDELPTEHIYRIQQDKEGYIWILTEEGLVKYNGTDTKIFTVKDGLPSNTVFNGYISDNNKFWFMCKGNELGYIENDSVFSYKIPKTNFTRGSGNAFRKNDVIYIDSLGYIEYKLSKGKWKSKKYSINDFDKNRVVLNTGPLYYADHSFSPTYKFYSKENKELISLNLEKVDVLKGVLVNTYKNYLTVKLQNKVYFINLENLNITEIDLKKYRIKESYINYVNNSFQITGANFVIKLNDKIKIEEEYVFDKKYNAHANLIDKDGNIWLGSTTTGVHYISKEAYYANLKDEDKDIKQSALYKNKLYYTNYQGIREFSSDNHFLDEENFSTLATSKNELFFGTNLVLSNSNRLVTPKRSPLPVRIVTHPVINVINYRKTNYISSFSFVYAYDSNFVFLKYLRKDYKSIITYEDSLIYGNNNGLFHFHTDKLSKGFDKPINCLKTNKKKLYIGTSGYGLFILKNNKLKSHQLKNTIINDILVYQDSLLFCSTNKGVICLKEIRDSLIPYYIFDKKDGLINLHVNAVHIDSSQNLYIATKKGILKTKLKKNQEASLRTFPILINYIKWNNKLIKDSIYNFLNEKENNTLNIKFSAIKFPKSEFYYKLNNNSYNRVNKGKIDLYNLPAGDYKITLKMESSFFQEETRELLFSIHSKWYKSNWFYMTLLMSALIILFFIIRNNRTKKNKKTIQKLQKQSELSDYKLHALRSQMNPHFVFNSLNSIQYYISENKNDLSEKYLVKFANLIRNFFDLATEKEISVKKEALLLDNYLEIEKMRFEDKLNYIIKIDDELDKATPIPTMILQPIVENSVNHGVFHKENEGLIEISFNKFEETKVMIIIQDDGVGIENSKQLKSSSFNNHLSKSTLIFNERIDLLNSTEQWEIECRTESLREHLKYPGTKTVVIIEHKKI